MFCREVALKNFAKFTRKNHYWSLSFDEGAVWRPKTLSKKRLRHWCSGIFKNNVFARKFFGILDVFFDFKSFFLLRNRALTMFKIFATNKAE